MAMKALSPNCFECKWNQKQKGEPIIYRYGNALAVGYRKFLQEGKFVCINKNNPKITDDLRCTEFCSK